MRSRTKSFFRFLCFSFASGPPPTRIIMIYYYRYSLIVMYTVISDWQNFGWLKCFIGNKHYEVSCLQQSWRPVHEDREPRPPWHSCFPKNLMITKEHKKNKVQVKEGRGEFNQNEMHNAISLSTGQGTRTMYSAE